MEIPNIQFTILYLVSIYTLDLFYDIILRMFSANCNKVGHFTQDCTVRSSSQVNLSTLLYVLEVNFFSHLQEPVKAPAALRNLYARF